MKRALVALAAVFLAAHLPLLPPTLEDIDSINFALGVRDFDVARHQPHPPGYPLFIALTKGSTAVMRAAGMSAPESRGIAVWSVLGAVALIFLVFALVRGLDGDDTRAWWTALLVSTAPLFWFTALRPLSDMWGLTAGVAAQALLVAAARGQRVRLSLLAGAFAAGVAIGFRSQTFLLTLPLLAFVLISPRLGLRMADRLAALAAAAAGVAFWAVPLVVASGGPTGYIVALGAQAGEDFAGVQMVYLARSARVLADALLHSFIWPWGHVVTGGAVVALAAVGALRAAWRMPRPLALMAVAFAPYTAFHLLFQEFQMVRYALPLVIPVAYLAVAGLEAAGTRARTIGVPVLAAAFLVLTVPATLIFGRQGSPGFRVLDDVQALAASSGSDEQRLELAYHGIFKRTVEWNRASLPVNVIEAPHGREWVSLVSAWRTGSTARVAFAADARRTDLALFDPHARRLVRTYSWGFVEPPFVGGARPGASELYVMRPPGWMLDRGWSLTAEVAGVTARDRRGPHLEPSVAWIRGRAEGATLMLGGRHVGVSGEPAARVTVSLAGRRLEALDVAAGPFFRTLTLQPGELESAERYLPLEVSSAAADGSARAVPVSLEQFDAQSPGTTMTGYREGWHEPEYNVALGRAWRWMSERATVWVRPVGRDVTLTLEGESPLRYFDRAPVVAVSVGGIEIARFEPAADFSHSVLVPDGLLAAADGQVIVQSDMHFVPGDRDGTGDRRRLALRVFRVAATGAPRGSSN